MPQVNLFLSTVSAEFRSYRDALRYYLERPNVMVKVQEDFIATDNETLDKLDDYIRQCDAVIHLVGDMTGALAQPSSLALIRTRYTDLGQKLPPLVDCLQPDAQAFSYTQWEAWLALYHRKTLIIAVPTRDAEHDAGYTLVEEQRSLQQQHLARLAAVGHYPEIRFANTDRLVVEVLRSKLHDILGRAGAVARPCHLQDPSIGDQFMGRDDWLEELCQSLGPVPDKAGSPAVARVLSGLGGIGKTRLALEYAWRHADSYSARLFVGADTAAALQSNLAALTQFSILNLPEQAETDEGKKRDAVLSWLNRHPGWLMILDNVDSEESASAVEDLIARLSGGHIIVTSRLSDFSIPITVNYSNALNVLPVQGLSETSASAFLLRRTDGRRRPQPDDNQQAEALARELGCLPLALEQAGAYIAQSRLTLKKYLQEWSGKRDRLLQWNHPRLMNYPTSVFVTWETSFNQLGESARQLLQRLAWLSPAPIPEALLDVPIPHVAGEGDPFAELTELEGYSLVTRATDSPSFTIHKLVQEVTRLQLNDPEQRCLNEMLQWIHAAFDTDPQDVNNWPVLEPLAPHALAIVHYADEQGIPDPTSRLMNQLGLMYFTKALYAEAEPLLRRALVINEASFGPGHPNVARSLNSLALLLRDTNRLDEAEPMMRRALAINEVRFGADHPEVATGLNNLAVLMKDTNRLAEAEPMMRRALAIDEANFGTGHPNVAIRLNNLAQLLQDTKRLTEAEPMMRRALAINEASFGAMHPRVATNLNNLAGLLQDTNRLAEAEPMMRRALAIDEMGFGAMHPRVATGLNNLAVLMKDTNRLAEAEPMMRRALAIDEANFGTEHPNVAIRLNNLAQLMKNTNRLDKAEPMMRRALAINEASFGAMHPSVATGLNNLAGLLQDTKRLAEAEPLMRRALAIDEANFGTEHPNVAIRLNNLAQLLRDTNRLDEAEPMMRRALAINEVRFGADHPEVTTGLNNLAVLLKDTNRLAEAEPMMRWTLAIDEASYGAEHPKVAIRLNNLAQLMKNTNRLDEAEPMMRRALAINEASFGTEHPNVATDLNNLAVLLKDTNRLAEAEPMMRRALAINEASFGAMHPRVATNLNNLAGLLQDTNRLAEAEPLMRRALAINEASFGTEHPNVATDLNNLAVLLKDTNRLAEAEPMMWRALAINEASFGAMHPRVATNLNNLAGLLQDTNRLAEAEPMMWRALAINEASFGTEHPNVATDLNNLAVLLKDTNRLAEAEPLLRRALAIFEARFGAEHPNTKTVFQNYVLLGQDLGWTEHQIIKAAGCSDPSANPVPTGGK